MTAVCLHANTLRRSYSFWAKFTLIIAFSVGSKQTSIESNSDKIHQHFTTKIKLEKGPIQAHFRYRLLPIHVCDCVPNCFFAPNVCARARKRTSHGNWGLPRVLHIIIHPTRDPIHLRRWGFFRPIGHGLYWWRSYGWSLITASRHVMLSCHKWQFSKQK